MHWWESLWHEEITASRVWADRPQSMCRWGSDVDDEQYQSRLSHGPGQNAQCCYFYYIIIIAKLDIIMVQWSLKKRECLTLRNDKCMSSVTIQLIMNSHKILTRRNNRHNSGIAFSAKLVREYYWTQWTVNTVVFTARASVHPKTS